jgi:hypothetical protein
MILYISVLFILVILYKLYDNFKYNQRKKEYATKHLLRLNSRQALKQKPFNMTPTGYTTQRENFGMQTKERVLFKNTKALNTPSAPNFVVTPKSKTISLLESNSQKNTPIKQVTTFATPLFVADESVVQRELTVSKPVVESRESIPNTNNQHLKPLEEFNDFKVPKKTPKTPVSQQIVRLLLI